MKISFPIRVAAVVLLLALAACGTQETPGGLQLQEGWVRAMPPGMKMTAAFGRLENRGAEAVQIVSWNSPDFGDVSLHRTEEVDGVSRMREVGTLDLPADGSAELRPGGLHLMLMMPADGRDPATPVTIEAVSGSGERYRFEIPVERR